MKTAHWWQDQPLTISAIQRFVCGGSKKAFDEYVSKASYDTEQLLHLFSPDGHEGMVYYVEEQHGKLLDDYLAHTAPSGIHQIAYTNTHCLPEEVGDAHPEFWQLDREGKPLLGYNVYHFGCVNPNGAFHRDILKNIRGLCSHKIGGIFLDGPIMNDKGCYCETCQKDFARKFGHSIYEATPFERHKMRVDSVTAHIKEIYETIKSINPEILLYINNSALRPDVTGSNTRRIYDYVDMVGAEGGFYFPDKEPIWMTSAFMKHLECVVGDPITAGKPMVNFISANDSGVSYQLKTAGEVATTYASTLANGANVWYGFHCDVFDGKDTPGAKKAREYNEFVQANRPLFRASRSCARLALMWSDCTANHYASSVAQSDFTEERESGYAKRGDHRTAFFSFVDMLERCHVQFDIVDEVSIAQGALEKYDALILPTVACLSDDNAARIAAFVENGGNLLGNFDVGMYHEDGRFAGKSKLAEVFGLVGEPKLYDIPFFHSVMFKAGDHPVLNTVTVPHHVVPSLDFEWQFTADVLPLMVAHPPRAGVYSDMPEERYPAYTERKYGKGRAYYLSGSFGETYVVRRAIGYRELVKGFCDYNVRPVVSATDTGVYEASLRRQEDKFLLHLVNKTGAMERPIDKLTPLYNLSVKLNLADLGIAPKDPTVTAMHGGKLTDLAQNGQEISFTLDKLDEYELIVIE